MEEQKNQLFKSLGQLELLGVKFDKNCTISDDIEDLKFLNLLGN